MKSLRVLLCLATAVAGFSVVYWSGAKHDRWETDSVATRGSGDTEEDEEMDLKPEDYFKDWYYPYDHWPLEMQQAADEAIQRLPGDDDVLVIDKKGRRRPASLQPWVQKGPVGMVNKSFDPPQYWSGRVASLGHHPATGLYVGSAEGGLWKPFFIGFIPASDQLPSLAIGGIAVHPDGPDTIFIGTGEYPGHNGTGVYRTTDAGATWELMPLTPTPTSVSKMLIPEWSHDVVFAAANTGLYRSTNGGDTWTRKLSGDFSDVASSSTGNFMLAGRRGSGIYRSTDLGNSWDFDWDLQFGLTDTIIGRISVAIAPSDTTRAYIQIGQRKKDSVYHLMKSTDKGQFWWSGVITPPPSALSGNKTNYLGQQDGNNALVVHPTNPDIVWAGGVFLMRTSDGGKTWNDVGATGGKPRQVHTDIEVLKYIDNQTLVVGCHGGIFVTTDEGQTWSSEYNKFLPITQFYNTDVYRQGGIVKTGGAQDNTLSRTTVLEPDTWVTYSGGDGIDAAVNQHFPNITYGTINGGAGIPVRLRTEHDLVTMSISVTNIYGTIDTNDVEQTFWNTFIVTDPASDHTLFTNAGRYVYWSENFGNLWSRMNSTPFQGVAKQLTVNTTGWTVYAPTDYPPQRLMRFRKIAGLPAWALWNISEGFPRNRMVKRVHPSTHWPLEAYGVLMGIGSDWKVMKTTDEGDTWVNITGNLPDVPVNDVVDDYNNSNVLYCATDKGAFRTTNGGGTWHRWNAGMPEAVRIMDLEYVFHPDGDYIFAGTYGRSTFERPVAGHDPILHTSKELFDFGSVVADVPSFDSCVISNSGDDTLRVSSIRVTDASIEVRPTRTTLAPEESLKIYVTFTPSRTVSGQLYASIEIEHNGEPSPTRLAVAAYVGDGTTFRSFPPESLLAKKEVKRITASTSWIFRFDNAENHREGANGLTVEFKNPLGGLTSYAPFASAQQLDDLGRKWRFFDGIVPTGQTATISGFTKRTKTQEVVSWWWNASMVVWNDDAEQVEDGRLGQVHGARLPESQMPGLQMPNAANLRNDVFLQYPFNGDQPFVIGVADPAARDNRIAYVALTRPADLYGSLIVSRTGRQHTGPPRCFDILDNGREMIGRFRKLSPDQQDNSLFAELAALKLNICASALGKTPAGFGELLYVDEGNRLNGLLVRQIDSVAGRYMTYCDSTVVGSGRELYDVVRRINEAFVGPIDTVSFGQKLVLTGVRPVAEVAYLERDPSIAPRRVEPRLQTASEILPGHFVLHQNYPNPFNPSTNIGFELGADAWVTVKIYNVVGQEMATLLDHEEMEGGEEEITFDATGLPSGVYFCRLVIETVPDPDTPTEKSVAVQTKKMLLIR